MNHVQKAKNEKNQILNSSKKMSNNLNDNIEMKKKISVEKCR